MVGLAMMYAKTVKSWHTSFLIFIFIISANVCLGQLFEPNYHVEVIPVPAEGFMQNLYPNINTEYRNPIENKQLKRHISQTIPALTKALIRSLYPIMDLEYMNPVENTQFKRQISQNRDRQFSPYDTRLFPPPPPWSPSYSKRNVKRCPPKLCPRDDMDDDDPFPIGKTPPPPPPRWPPYWPYKKSGGSHRGCPPKVCPRQQLNDDYPFPVGLTPPPPPPRWPPYWPYRLNSGSHRVCPPKVCPGPVFYPDEEPFKPPRILPPPPPLPPQPNKNGKFDGDCPQKLCGGHGIDYADGIFDPNPPPINPTPPQPFPFKLYSKTNSGKRKSCPSKDCT